MTDIADGFGGNLGLMSWWDGFCMVDVCWVVDVALLLNEMS